MMKYGDNNSIIIYNYSICLRLGWICSDRDWTEARAAQIDTPPWNEKERERERDSVGEGGEVIVRFRAFHDVLAKFDQKTHNRHWLINGLTQVNSKFPPQTWIIGKPTALLRDVEEYFTILYLWKSLPEIPIRAGIVLMQEGLLWFLANGNGGSHAQCQPGCQSTSSGIPSCTSQHRLDRTMWCC